MSYSKYCVFSTKNVCNCVCVCETLPCC